MKSKTKILVFFISLILLASGAYAAVSSAGGPGKNKPSCHAYCPYSKLKLSGEQMTKLKALKEKFWKETIFLRNQMHVKRLELKTLWAVPKPEKDKIVAKQKELMDLFNQLQTKVTDYRLEARSYLTPEQSAQAGIICPDMGFGGHRQGRHMHKYMNRHMAGSWNKEGNQKNNE